MPRCWQITGTRAPGVITYSARYPAWFALAEALSNVVKRAACDDR